MVYTFVTNCKLMDNLQINGTFVTFLDGKFDPIKSTIYLTYQSRFCS